MSRIGRVYGMTRGLSFACVSGYAAALRSPIVVNSAWASSWLMPGASRPKMKISGPCPRAYLAGLARRATQ
jgi:hypothetical protein